VIPSVFEYLTEHADKLFIKAAEAAIREEAFPEFVPPDALPGTKDRTPPHPMWVGAKQELPIGAGIAAGALLGGGIPYVLERSILKRTLPIPTVLSTALGSIIGGIAAHRVGLADKEREAELNRAKQEYEDYLKRRAGNLSSPSIQSPAIRT
jgi:hypothetical protein